MILSSQKENGAEITLWSLAAKKLLEEQKQTWQLLKNNYEALPNVLYRNLSINDQIITLQNNPARIFSTLADVSNSGINSRPCFLCLNNLPQEQKALEYGKHYLILCNPYPIFEEHFTIVHKKHIPQNIINNFDDFLDITQKLGFGYSLFYNGPKCGASAPDHLHFQAAKKGIIPIENELDQIKNWNDKNIISTNKIEITFIENYLRYGFLIESGNKAELIDAFKIFIRAFKNISSPDEEPMMNIISLFSDETWQIIIFPRKKHRPSHYFEKDNKKIIVSPAAVDMGGMFILPRSEDYNKINEKDILDIYNQVTITKEFFEYLKKKIVDSFNK